MSVFVLIEFTGSPAACDGAVIHGVYSHREFADEALAGFASRSQRFMEIQEFEVWTR